jgi:hypothetical protein
MNDDTLRHSAAALFITLAACTTTAPDDAGRIDDAAMLDVAAADAALDAGGPTDALRRDVGPRPAAGTDLAALAAATGELAAGAWLELPGTNIRPVLLTHEEADAIDPNLWAVSGSMSALIIWSASAFDGQRWYVGAAGWHNGYNGNELYELDLATLSWSRRYDPSPLDRLSDECARTGCMDWIPEWGPAATHQYDGLVYSPATDSIFYFGTGAPACYELALAEPDPRLAWSSFPCPEGITSYVKTATLASGHLILYPGGQGPIVEWDPRTRTEVGRTAEPTGWLSYSVADHDPSRDLVYSVNQGDAQGVVAIGAGPTATFHRGEVPGELGGNHCAAFDPTGDRLLAWNGERAVHAWDPETHTWESWANEGGPAPALGGEWRLNGKCFFVDSLGLLVGYANGDGGVWAYRVP